MTSLEETLQRPEIESLDFPVGVGGGDVKSIGGSGRATGPTLSVGDR